MTASQTAGSAPQDVARDDAKDPKDPKDAIYDLRYRHVTISDGMGGVLSFDLTAPGLDELGRAFTALLTGTLPPGACLLRVWAGDDTYLLRRVKRAPNNIGISRLGAQTQEVSLTEDVLQLVVGIFEQTRPLRAPTVDRAVRHSDD